MCGKIQRNKQTLDDEHQGGGEWAVQTTTFLFFCAASLLPWPWIQDSRQDGVFLELISAKATISYEAEDARLFKFFLGFSRDFPILGMF